jgi:polar amino acid transport system substrate-binding protein
LPPYGYTDANGQPIGFCVEVAKYFAAKLGVGIEYVQVTAKSRIPLIVNGTIDADIGVTTPTVEREQVIDFSIPYLSEGVTLMVRKDSGIKAFADAKVVAVTQGSINADRFMKVNPAAKIVYFQDYPQAALAVESKKADALALPRENLMSFAKGMPELGVLNDDFYREYDAIGLKQNDSKWRNWINVTRQEMWCKGEFQRLYEKFVGTPPHFYLWSPTGLEEGIKC